MVLVLSVASPGVPLRVPGQPLFALWAVRALSQPYPLTSHRAVHRARMPISELRCLILMTNLDTVRTLAPLFSKLCGHSSSTQDTNLFGVQLCLRSGTGSSIRPSHVAAQGLLTLCWVDGGPSLPASGLNAF